MSVGVGIDSGQTGTRLAIARDGVVVALGEGPGFRYEAGKPPVAGVLQGVTAAWRDAGGVDEVPEMVCLGMTGPCGNGVGLEHLAAGIRALMGPVGLVRATGDHVTSYAGAIGTGPGLVLAAGTGVIALAATAERRLHRADGWGYLLGDAGSGFWIGRRGLEAAFRAVDGRGPTTALQDAARHVFGGPGEIHEAIYLQPQLVRTVAAFSLEVAVCAEAGDEVARHIWHLAAEELATTCSAAAGRAFAEQEPFQLSCVGGVFRAGSLIWEPFRSALSSQSPNAVLREPNGTALDGAVLLAQADDIGSLEQGVADHRG